MSPGKMRGAPAIRIAPRVQPVRVEATLETS